MSRTAAAVVTFRFERPDPIARRALALGREGGAWRSLRVHASGLEVAKE